MSNRASEVYRGPERRRRRVLVTRNSEYHCVDGVCVAVRDRTNGQFLRGHRAIGRHVDGSIRYYPTGGIAAAHDAAHVEPGEQVYLSSGDIDDPGNLLTSELIALARPSKGIVAAYPMQQPS
jgi:hypothetical protein